MLPSSSSSSFQPGAAPSEALPIPPHLQQTLKHTEVFFRILSLVSQFQTQSALNAWTSWVRILSTEPDPAWKLISDLLFGRIVAASCANAMSHLPVPLSATPTQNKVLEWAHNCFVDAARNSLTIPPFPQDDSLHRDTPSLPLSSTLTSSSTGNSSSDFLPSVLPSSDNPPNSLIGSLFPADSAEESEPSSKRRRLFPGNDYSALPIHSGSSERPTGNSPCGAPGHGKRAHAGDDSPQPLSKLPNSDLQENNTGKRLPEPDYPHIPPNYSRSYSPTQPSQATQQRLARLQALVQPPFPR